MSRLANKNVLRLMEYLNKVNARPTSTYQIYVQLLNRPLKKQRSLRDAMVVVMKGYL